MKRNDQSIYRRYAESLWNEPYRFQRMLISQVRPRFEYMDRVTRNWSGIETLDLGSGGGFMSETLALRGAKVTGVDPCAPLLEAARKHAQSRGLEITYIEGAGESIPLPAASVDRVVCVDVLEHVENVAKVVAEVRRVLRPGGLFFFDTINRNRLSAFMVVTLTECLLRILPRGAHDSAKFIRPDELKEYLERSGFKCTHELVGMGVIGLDRHLEIKFGLKESTRIMYIGHAS